MERLVTQPDSIDDDNKRGQRESRERESYLAWQLQ